MLMDFLIKVNNTDHNNKWEQYVQQKNMLYASFGVECHEVKKDFHLEHRDEISDDLVGLVTLDLCPEKLFLLKHISKKDYETMTGREAKDAQEWLRKDREGKDVQTK
jgi:hypothetical protein